MIVADQRRQALARCAVDGLEDVADLEDDELRHDRGDFTIHGFQQERFRGRTLCFVAFDEE
jgi:hypothetical protein